MGQERVLLERPGLGRHPATDREVRPGRTGRAHVPAARSPDDAELMVLIQQGDMRAFEAFYDRHVALALGAATRILHDRSLAEDAVQEGFVGIWRSRASYRPQAATAKSWLLVIVRNRAIDLSRRDRTRPSVPADDVELAGLHAPGCTEEEVIAESDHQELRAQLQRLPDEQRRAIELAYFGGLTHGEIARQLGLPLGTAKGRVRLGLEKLRRARTEDRVDSDSPTVPAAGCRVPGV